MFWSLTVRLLAVSTFFPLVRRAGRPFAASSTSTAAGGTGGANYAVAGDGSLVDVKGRPSAGGLGVPPRILVLVQHWDEELKAKLPGGK